MPFIQIVSFRTDHIQTLRAGEQQWLADTVGRRTLLASQLLVDRDDPRHFVTTNLFPSHQAAVVNSSLPETDALARAVSAVADPDVTFTDLDVVEESDDRTILAAGLRRVMETSTADPGTLAADGVVDLLFPNYVGALTGTEAMTRSLREEAPGRAFSAWQVGTTDTGFVVEYDYRTTGGGASTRSVGTILATVTGGRISRLLVTCAGGWDAATEAAIYGTAGVAS